MLINLECQKGTTNNGSQLHTPLLLPAGEKLFSE
jgi:hypothetical protein